MTDLRNHRTRLTLGTLAVVAMASAASFAADWPMWGRTVHRNMASPETGIPATWSAGVIDLETGELDVSDAKNLKWVAKLGSQSYGNPSISNGRVFVGTNNATPRNPALTGDRANVLCFDESTGRFLWQYSAPKLGAGKVSDWEYLGICSSPAVEGDRVYFVTNRCEVICVDFDGMADGNDGPFTDEADYVTGGKGEGVEPLATDADIVWVFDMRDELGIFPHNITSSSPLVYGDYVATATSNGVDWSHTNIPNPRAPSLVVLNRHTGELFAEEASGISQRMLHSNWSSPAYAEVENQPTLIFGAGDGFCYGFDTKPVTDEDGFDVLRELWRFDCNPPHYWKKNGKPIKYTRFSGPSEIISTPVYHDGRVFAMIGQDPEHGEGVGALSCIDPTRRGDISETGLVWRYTGIERTISTPSIGGGLVYAADYTGRVHCVDEKTGEPYWVHDTGSHIWGSTLLVDGKVYIGNEDGIVTVLEHGKEKKVLAEIDMGAPVYASPVVANGTLYIMSMTHLYAISTDGK